MYILVQFVYGMLDFWLRVDLFSLSEIYPIELEQNIFRKSWEVGIDL